MPLDRTWYSTLVDDDGSNTVGTVWNKAAVDSLMDAIDLQIPPTGVAVGQVLVSNGVGVAPAWSDQPIVLLLGTQYIRGTSVLGLQFQIDSSTKWRINNASPYQFYPEVHNAYDFGISTGAVRSFYAGTSYVLAGVNGQLLTTCQQLTELTTIAAAATTDTTIQMPANSVVLAVSVRVTVVIPTAATFTVGDSGSAARFSTAAVSVAANSTDPGTKAGAYYNAGALSVRITPNLTPGANSGRVRVTIYYYTVTPPTS